RGNNNRPERNPGRDRAQERARFEREARAAARLDPRHVAEVFDVDVTDEGSPYIVMEYLEGMHLGAELAHKERLSIDDAVEYLTQLCAGIGAAHREGIVHRDLKPANLFRVREGGGALVVKILDFGVSKVAEEDAAVITDTSEVFGTPRYMAPEQLR